MALRDRLTRPVATAIPAIPAILEPSKPINAPRIATIATIAAPPARFWKLCVVEDSADWVVSTLPEVTIAEAQRLWPHAVSVEGIA